MAVGQWPIDPDVKRSLNHGKPPDGHSRRCQGNLNNGTQCTQWARRGHPYCKRHLNPKSRKMTDEEMSNSYLTRRVGKALRSNLEALSNYDTDVADLTAEIEVARLLGEQAFAMFNKISEKTAADYGNDEAKYQKLRDDITRSLKTAMAYTAKLIKSQAQVQAMQGTLLPSISIDKFVKAMSDVLLKHVDNPVTVDAIVKDMMNADLDSPGQGNSPQVTINIGD